MYILYSILVHFVGYRYKVLYHRAPNPKVPICKGPNHKLPNLQSSYCYKISK